MISRRRFLATVPGAMVAASLPLGAQSGRSITGVWMGGATAEAVGVLPRGGGKMIIQRATIEDAADILALQKLAYLSEAALYDDYTIKPLKQTLKNIRGEFEDYLFLKVTERDKIIGSVRARLLEDGNCYIGRLMVHPHHQNQGIGKRLMEEVEKSFKTCPRFILTAGHLSHHNLNFYQKLGYSPYRTEKVTDKIDLVYLENVLD